MGVGEKLTGFEKFHPDRVAGRILGMGDIVSLVEEAKKGIDQHEAEKLAKKLKSGKAFDLNDFLAQISQGPPLDALVSPFFFFKRYINI